MSGEMRQLAEVFASLHEGTFLEQLDKFTNDQLRPFLPMIFVSTFNASNDPTKCNSELLSRIISFEEANQLHSLSTLPFKDIETKMRTATIFGCILNSHLFRTGTDEEKMRALCMKLVEPDDEDDITADISPFISDDILDEASLYLSLACLHCPAISPPSRLAFLAVAYQNAPYIVARVVANNPELLYPVLSALCEKKMSRMSDESPRGKQRAHIIVLLLSLCPGAAEFMVGTLLESRVDCPLGLKLAVDNLTDESLIALIPPEIINPSRPLELLKKRGVLRHGIHRLYQRLAAMGQSTLEGGEPIPDSQSFLLCWCTLFHQSSYKPNADDAELLVSYIIASSTRDAHDCHIIIAVATVLGIPNVNMNNAHTTRIVEWLSSLRMMCITGGSSRATLSHALLFICTSLITKKTDQLAPFLTEILKMKVVLNARHLTFLQTLIVDAGFTEREVALMCTRLPVTVRLSADAVDVQIPAYCVNELLQANVFQKNGILITDWVQRQMVECVTPLHSLMVALLDRLAITSVADSVRGVEEEFIQSSFSGPISSSSMLTRRVLCTFFLLSYRLHYDTATATDKVTQRVLLYTDELYTKIPLRYILGLVEVEDSSYSSIRSWLTRIAVELYPYMLPSTTTVQIVRESLGRERRVKEDIVLDEKELIAQLSGKHPLAAVRRIEAAPLSEQVRLLPLIVNCTLLSLAPSTPHALVMASTRLWMRLEAVVPRPLIETTSVEWLRAGGCKDMVPVDKLYEMPPLLFRVDQRIFSSPPHLSCFLRALSFFLTAGRNALQKVLSTCAEKDDFPKVERDVVSSTNDHSQAATIVHMLIEIIDPKRFERNEALSPARLDELHTLVCEELHQMFIADRQLLKLVLWQTIPLHLLPSLVESIDSLHVALDFVHELLCSSDMHRRLFAVALTAQISQKYRIHHSAKVMELVLDVLHTLIKVCPTALHLSLMERVLPWLEQTIEVFPMLAGDITQMMMNVSAIAKSRLALNPLVISTKTAPEVILIRSIDESLTRSVSKMVL